MDMYRAALEGEVVGADDETPEREPSAAVSPLHAGQPDDDDAATEDVFPSASESEGGGGDPDSAPTLDEGDVFEPDAEFTRASDQEDSNVIAAAQDSKGALTRQRSSHIGRWVFGDVFLERGLRRESISSRVSREEWGGWQKDPQSQDVVACDDNPLRDLLTRLIPCCGGAVGW